MIVIAVFLTSQSKHGNCRGQMLNYQINHSLSWEFKVTSCKLQPALKSRNDGTAEQWNGRIMERPQILKDGIAEQGNIPQNPKRRNDGKSPEILACEYSRLSFAPATMCETRRQTSAIHRQKFHTDDVNLS